MPKLESWVGILTAFSALAVVLGYVFELGFVSGFDPRLLQFLSVEDYISTASFYVFAIPIAVFGTSVVISDNIQMPSRVRAIVRYYFLEDRKFVPVQQRKAKRVGSYILGISVAFAVILIGIGFADEKLAILSKSLKNAGYILLPLAIWAFSIGVAVRYLSTVEDPGERRIAGATALVLLCSIAMYLYGGYEGTIIRAIGQNDVRVIQKEGHEIDAVLVGRFSSGIAVKYVGDASIYFVPESNVVQIILLKQDTAN